MPYSTPVLTGSIPSPATAPLTGILTWTASTGPGGNDGSLLLHFDGTNGSTSFPDSSGVGNIMTVYNAAVTVSTAAPEFGTGCGDFVASAGGYLYTPLAASGPLDLGSGGDWTIEMWLNFGTQSAPGGVAHIVEIGGFAQAPYNYTLYVNNGAGGALSFSSPGGATSTTSYPANTWFALAVVNYGGTVQMYVNGSAVGTPYGLTAHSNVGGNVTIGGQYGTSNDPFNGFIDELRITKGTALYTSNYTPSGPFPSAPNAVQLLLLMAGANTSQTFVDSSQNAFVVTNHNAATQSNTEAPSFETTSGDFTSGAGNQYVSVPLVGSGPLDLSTGDFTIEGWLYMPASMVGAEGNLIGTNNYEAEILCNQIAGGYKLICTISGSSAQSATNSVPNATWVSFAFTCTSNVLQVWINGVASGSPGNIVSRVAMTDTSWIFGQHPGTPASVYLSNIRISTAALYSGPYTPTGPLSPGGGVVDATAYHIYRNGASLTTTGQVLTYTDTVPTPGIYAYNVAAWSGSADESAQSNTVTLEYDTYSAPVLSGSIPNPSQPNTGVLTWTQSTLIGGSTPASGYVVFRDGLLLAYVGAVLTYTDIVGVLGTHTYDVFAYDPVDASVVSPESNVITLIYSAGVIGITNCIFDEAIYGCYFGGQLNLVEFTYMPGRTPFEEGATNLIINRYKQEPTDVRQRGVSFVPFVIPGELLQSVVVSGINAQGVPQAQTNPLVTPLVISNVVIDPVTQLIFGYTVSGGQDGIEYTVQFTTITNVQQETLEEIFSINFMVEDSFP
jgi:hypothetical protein